LTLYHCTTDIIVSLIIINFISFKNVQYIITFIIKKKDYHENKKKLYFDIYIHIYVQYTFLLIVIAFFLIFYKKRNYIFRLTLILQIVNKLHKIILS